MITSHFRVVKFHIMSKSLQKFITENLCNLPVGLQRGSIANRAMTASSQFNKFHAAFLGRLHRRKRGRFVGAWRARYNNYNQWLQVDLGRTMKITGIATQGRQDKNEWVTAYWVLYGSDGLHFSLVKHWWNNVKVGVVRIHRRRRRPALAGWSKRGYLY